MTKKYRARKKTGPSLAEEIAHLHLRITMLAGRLETRTAKGTLARMDSLLQDMTQLSYKMANWMFQAEQAHNTINHRLNLVCERLDSLTQILEADETT